MKERLKVLLVFDSPFYAPRGYDFKEEMKDIDWDAEKSILKALQENGYEVTILGIYNDISPLLEEVKENPPDVIFNSADVFNQQARFDKNMAAVLEMLEIPYTGASPANLMICNDKALSKKILNYHRIKVPGFHTFYRNRPVRLFKRLHPPLIVKPLQEEASRGISQASVVDNEEALVERVNFIHNNMKMDAIAEDYIDGRELYVSLLGNKRVRVLPFREMNFGKMPEDEPRIATYKAKWDYDYAKKWGIDSSYAQGLDALVEKKVADTCKRAYRALNMKCYARFDIRVTPEGTVYIIEANANPSIDPDDEFVMAAAKVGITYKLMVRRFVKLAFERTP